MKSFKQHIKEMAVPRESDRSKTYYHGTSTEDAFRGISNDGIDSNKSVWKYGTYSPMKPVANMIYMTPNLRYAVIYALGGDFIGSKSSKTFAEPYGYLCVIDGKDLGQNIQPDEDSIGELVYKKKIKWLYDMANKYLSDVDYEDEDEMGGYESSRSILDAILDGEYGAFAAGGKILVKHMSDEQKHSLLDQESHVAHEGKIKPKEIWAFKKEDSHLLDKEASNFFKLAKKVK